MKLIGLFLLGLLAFAVTIIWKFPAAGVLPHVNLAPMVVSGVSGSVWRGAAASVVAPNAPQPVTNLRWRVLPQALLQASAGVQLDFDWAGGAGQADVVRSVAGDITVSDATMQLPASSLEEYLPLPVAQFAGTLNAAVDTMIVVQNRLRTTTGKVIWRNAVVSGAVNAKLGQITVDVAPEGEAHLATLVNSAGELDIKGDFRLEQNGEYRADIRIKPVPGTPRELESSLAALGRPASDGSYRVRNNGNIADFL